MKMTLIAVFAGLAFSITATVQADIRVPGQPYSGPAKRPEADPTPAPAKANDKAVALVVKLDSNISEAHLQIPKKMLVAEAQGEEKKTGLFSPESRSIVAGLALSAGMVSLLLLPRWKRSTRVTAATVAGFLIVAGTFGIAWGNLPPRPDRPKPSVTKESVVVEVVANGDAVTLTLSPDMLARIQKSVNGN